MSLRPDETWYGVLHGRQIVNVYEQGAGSVVLTLDDGSRLTLWAAAWRRPPSADEDGAVVCALDGWVKTLVADADAYAEHLERDEERKT